MLRVQFRVHYHRRVTLRALLTLGLLSVVLLVTLTVNGARAIAPDAPSSPNATSGARQYYLTRLLVQAHEAPLACANGYHFASIWEIADSSALKYNTGLGLFGPDSGGGPPTAISFMGSPFTAQGWVRTGFAFSTSSIPGQANCGNWLINDSFYWGTVANLPSNWTGSEQDIGVWNVGVKTCDTNLWVWCVQDDSVWRVFLPLVLRST
jgi:hypothetical protein